MRLGVSNQVKKNYSFRIQSSLVKEARKVAKSEGVTLIQLINVALAEKLSALRTEEYFLERIRRADRAETMRILNRAGKEQPPIEGDEFTVDLSSNVICTRKTNKAEAKAGRIGKLKRRLQKSRSR